MEKYKKLNLVSLMQASEYYCSGEEPLDYIHEKDALNSCSEKDMANARVKIRSHLEAGRIKAYGVSGKIEIYDPLSEEGHLKLASSESTIKYPYNDLLIPEEHFSHRYAVASVYSESGFEVKREKLPKNLNKYDFDWNKSIIAKDLHMIEWFDGEDVWISTEGYAFVALDIGELKQIRKAEHIDYEEAEELLIEAIETDSGKKELKNCYRVLALKLKNLGENNFSASERIKSIFDIYRKSYPTTRTIMSHIADIIPSKKI